MHRTPDWRGTGSRILAAAGLLLAVVLPLGAQAAAAPQGWNPDEILKAETYVRPPAVVERIITSPRTDISFTNPSPDRKWFLRSVGPDRGDVKYYGKGHIYLAGLQVDTVANRSRALTDHGTTALLLVDPRTGSTRTIAAPPGALIVSPVWSPSGAQIAYIANFDGASQIFVADVSTGKSTQVTKTPLLATLVTSVDWTADGKQHRHGTPPRRPRPGAHARRGRDRGRTRRCGSPKGGSSRR